jgi:cytochrome c-type biogenesis protein
LEDPAAGIGVLTAFGAGLVSFLSPCVLPLVPGYLSAVSGVAPSELERSDWRATLVPSLLFVASFSAIFIALGLAATGIGDLLREHRAVLTDVAGVLIIVMGLLFVASFFLPRLGRTWHVEALLRRAGTGGPLVAGAAFAIAWTPCVGPALGSILGLAATQGTVAKGGALLAVYSAGLAVPFLLTAVAFNQATTALAWLKRHYAVINGLAGALLISIGVLVITGELFRLNIEAQKFLDQWDLNFFQEF